MSEPSWLNYTGAITGFIGAITGIAGAVIAYVAFLRTDRIKALELRLELRKIESALCADIHDLVPFLEKAKASHTRLAAARGAYGSRATKHWLSQWETDLVEAKSLAAGSSVLDVDCSKFSQAALEARLITVHKLQRQVSQLTGRYQDSLAADDKGREQLSADQRVITQARLKDKP